ncbi:MAG: lipoprotein signal peptidase [Bacteroidia bacterium]|nr:lipoprotein signal peptidase [Bacteroidia bacterium]
MKAKNYFLPVVILVVVLGIDQYFKFYIKNNFFLGEEVSVIGNWFKLHFTENYGMAFGLEFGGKTGKVFLTLFRIIFVGAIGYYIKTLVDKDIKPVYVCSWVLIVAGALGNIIDSVFYGVYFGYDSWFHGRVVDMLYFPIIRTTLPDSFPFWAGEEFEFFRPVFNVADAAISIGFMLILIFQKHANVPEKDVDDLQVKSPVEERFDIGGGD